jgi:intracellular multiplication protein IcmJ
VRLLPLTLSAHLSAWFPGGGAGGLQEVHLRSWSDVHPATLPVRGDPTTCRFCGVLTSTRHEPFHLNGDHADNRHENLVYACTLCHLAQHLDEAEATDGATLAWLPEFPQPVLTAVLRNISSLLANRSSTRRPTLATLGAQRMLAALQRRSEDAHLVVGTSSAATLGAALLALEPAAYRERAHLLDGIRLLPTGRLIRSGKDRFPELLRQWQEPATTSATGTAA